MDTLTIVVRSVRMAIGFGGDGIKSKSRFLIMANLKRSIIEVKAKYNCLAHALIIAISRVNYDPNYKSYRDGKKIVN